MRTVWVLKAKLETGKVQRLATRESWPGVVLFGWVFYNYSYAMGIKPKRLVALS
jgi:hypothetical protein